MFTDEAYYDNVAGEYRLTLRGHRHPADTSTPNTSRRVDKKYLAKTRLSTHRERIRSDNLTFLKEQQEQQGKPKGARTLPDKFKRQARIRTITVASAREKGNK